MVKYNREDPRFMVILIMVIMVYGSLKQPVTSCSEFTEIMKPINHMKHIYEIRHQKLFVSVHYFIVMTDYFISWHEKINTLINKLNLSTQKLSNERGWLHGWSEKEMATQ